MHLDWGRMLAFKRRFTDPVPEKRAAQFKKHGIDAYQGFARFTGRDTVAIDDREFEARHVLIATGAEPRPLPCAGAEHLVTSDEFLSLESLPESLVLVGGGYIGFEFAHTAARVGARVTIVQRRQPLGHFDPDMVQLLVEKSRRVAIDVQTETSVEAVEQTDAGVRVQARHHGEAKHFEAAMAVHAAGRVPALGALDLEAGGVERDEQGLLRLTPGLRSTSNPAVFAAGDAAARGPALTPVAAQDADIVVDNLLEEADRIPDYTGVPSVAFTIPPIGRVGLHEAEARRAGLKFRVNHGDMSDSQVVRHVGEDTGAYKVLIEEESERILGVHLIGPGTIEMLNILAFAVRLGIPATEVKRLMSAFPSAASNLFHLVQ